MRKFIQIALFVILTIICAKPMGLAESPVFAQGTDTLFARRPAWAPDGTKIVFESLDKANKTSLWILDLTTSDVTSLFSSEQDTLFTQWSPDSQRIAFWMENSDTWVINSDGSNPQNLTEDFDNVDWLFAWSPDSQYLVVTSYPENTSSDIHGMSMWAVNVDSLEKKMLAEVPIEDSIFWTSWSSDGSKILYTQLRDVTKPSEIRLIDIESLESTTLVEGPYETANWSPDGSLISILSRDCETGYSILLLKTATLQVSGPIGGDCSSIGIPPIWSPNGDFIAYQNSLETFRVIRIADNQEVAEFEGQNPTWSPTSKEIAFTLYQNHGSNIYTVNIETSKITQLTGK